MNRHFDKHTGRMAQIGLAQQIALRTMWPTPTANQDKKARGNPLKNAEDTMRRGFSLGLPEVVAWRMAGRVWPTPTATQHKGWSPNHNRADTDDRLDYTVERQSFQPGQSTPPMRLNPAWVEWLMGWPSGWTDLKPLAMAKFREWYQQHGRR
jgi:DNA (cytosine-5)-methyltransferase 1